MSKHEFKHILSTHCNRHLGHMRPIAFRMHADICLHHMPTLFFLLVIISSTHLSVSSIASLPMRVRL